MKIPSVLKAFTACTIGMLGTVFSPVKAATTPDFPTSKATHVNMQPAPKKTMGYGRAVFQLSTGLDLNFFPQDPLIAGPPVYPLTRTGYDIIFKGSRKGLKFFAGGNTEFKTRTFSYYSQWPGGFQYYSGRYSYRVATELGGGLHLQTDPDNKVVAFARAGVYGGRGFGESSAGGGLYVKGELLGGLRFNINDQFSGHVTASQQKILLGQYQGDQWPRLSAGLALTIGG